MTPESSSTDATSIQVVDREIIIERIFNAPRELVFKAWTEPEQLKQWYGPKTWPVTLCKIDLRPGGIWHYCMTGPNGEQAWGKAVYQEIVAPERLVYTDSFSDADGNVNADLPTMQTTVTFTDESGKTKLVSRSIYPTAADVKKVLDMGMAEGLTEALSNLDALLAK